jgi:Ca2+-binding RTX toxin-like protein
MGIERRANAMGQAGIDSGSVAVQVSAADLQGGSFERDGDALIVHKASGEVIRINGFFAPGSQATLLSASGGVYSAGMVEAMLEGDVPAHPNGTSGQSGTEGNAASGTGDEHKAIAHVADATPDVKVVRDGQELALHAGDPVFEGDQVVTAAKGQVTFDMTTGADAGNANNLTLGENSRVSLTLASGAGDTVHVSVKAGNVIAAETPDSLHIVIDTPSGSIRPQSASVDVTVNATTSEVQVQMVGGTGDVAIQSASGPVVLNQSNQSTVLSSDTGGAGLIRAADLHAGSSSQSTGSFDSNHSGSGSLSGSGTSENGLSSSPFSNGTNGSFSGLGSSTGGNGGGGPQLSSSPLAGGPAGGGSSGTDSPSLPPVPTSPLPGNTPTTQPPVNLNTPPVTPEISIADIKVEEQAGVVHIEIKLSSVTTLPVTVDLVVPGTSGDGRIAAGVHTVTVNPGSTAVVVDIPITSDLVRQPDTELLLTLQNPTGGVLGKGTAMLTVFDVAPIVAGNSSDEVIGGGGDDSVDGGGGNDSIEGGAGNDTVAGGEGNDTVNGGEGNDNVDGGSGNDSVDGGTGSDTVAGGMANDTVTGGEGNDSADGGEGNDSVDGGTGNDTVTGGAGNDTVTGGEGNDSVDGGAGDDSVDGGTGNDSVTGGTGNDTVTGGDGDDSVDGGAGNDTVDGGVGNDTVSGGAGNDSVGGGDGDDTVLGGDASDTGDDTVDGGAGNDSVDGGQGNDSVTGGEGNDTLSGGTGDDTVDGGVGDDSVNGGEGNDSADGGEGNDTVDGGAGNDTVSGGTGNDSVGGGDGDDTVLAGDPSDTGDDTVDGGTGNDSVDGGQGNDTVTGGAGNDTVAGGTGDDNVDGGDDNDTVDGGTGNDTVVGGAGNDSVDGGDGNDDVAGGTGDDTVNGGNGNDTVNGGDGNDSVDGGAGNDTVDGGIGNDTVSGGTGNDSVGGGDGDDTVLGGDPSDTGDDTVDGGTGNDSVDGGQGNDTVTGGAGNDTVAGGTGDDSVDGGDDNDTVDGGTGNDTVAGGAGNDSIDGGDGNDSAGGGTGDDTVNGGNGNDTVSGGDGNDSVDGGAGNDTVDGGIGNDTVSGGAGNDSVGGGDGEDTVLGGDPSDTGDDTVDGGAGNDSVDGGQGNDTVTGGTGNDTVMGGAGNDSVDGGDGNDSVDGGAGNDTVDGGIGNDTVSGGAGNDSAGGGDGDDTVLGGNPSDTGDDTLDGGAGNDSVDGGQGNDTVAGGAGNDTVMGGDGNDSVGGGDGDDSVDGGTGNDTVDGGVGNDTVSGGAGNDSVGGGDGNDTVLGGDPSDTGDDTLDGGAGNDSVDGGQGNDTVTGGTGNDTVLGGAGNDSVDGGDDDDRVDGGDGNDTVGGGNGNDSVSGGIGDDTATGGAGNDSVDGSAGNDSVDGGIGDDTVTGSAGNDTLTGGDGNDSVDGGADNDSIDGGNGDDTVDGGSGNDTVGGGAGNDVVRGGDGDDVLKGGAGNDTLDGGDGNDTADYSDDTGNVHATLGAPGDSTGTSTGSDTLTNIENITGGAGNDTLAGDGGDNVLSGAAGNDSLDGGAGNDSLDGGLGNDTISGGTGADTLNGGSGDDVLIYDAADTLIDGGAGNDTLVIKDASVDLTAVGDTVLQGIEQIDLSGNGDNTLKLNSADVLALSNTTDTVIVHGDAGDKLIVVGTWTAGGTQVVNGQSYNIYTSNGATLVVDPAVAVLSEYDGTNGDDTVTGGTGNDLVLGLDGNDSMSGGNGDDVLRGGAGNDTIDGGSGNDTADYTDETGNVSVTLGAPGSSTGTSTGNDTLTNIENVTGGAGNDTINGDGGDNILSGGAGNDVIDGGAGNDTIKGGAGSDTLTGGTGTDTLDYSDDSGSVSVDLGNGTGTDGSGGSDTLSGFENVTGGSGNDTLTGDSGNNKLDGGAGNDMLKGGAGNDTLTGGTGTDTLDYSDATGNVTANLVTGTGTDGSGGTDTYSGIENIKAGSGNDALTGDSSANVLEGGAGDDTLTGGAGNDTLIGGSGNDMASYSTDVNGVTIDLVNQTASGSGAGTDSLSGIENAAGGSGWDNITGDGGDNLLIGNAGNDTLIGGVGNDTLRGGAGADRLDGGTGTDVADYSDVTGPLTINLGTGSVTGGTAGSDTLISIEGVIGSGGADTITGSGNDDYIDGGAGADSILGGAGNDTIAYDVSDLSVDGGTGNADVLSVATGTSVIDLTLTDDTVIKNIEIIDLRGAGSQLLKLSSTDIKGLDTDSDTANTVLVRGDNGSDSVRLVGGGWSGPSQETVDGVTYNVYGRDGATIKVEDGVGVGFLINGGAGDDSVTGNGGSDEFYGGDGNDTFGAGGGDDSVDGGSGNDVLSGDIGNDTIDGGIGNDTIDGGSGNDSLLGGTGDDSISAGDGNDTVDAGSGNDNVSGGDGNDSLIGGDGNDTIDGGAGQDTILGSGGDDLLRGSGGNDSIDGGTGNDTLAGGTGSDTLDGGAGQSDWVDYSDASGAVNVNLGTGTSTARSTGDSGSDTLLNIENVIGTSGADSITGSDAANQIDGKGSNADGDAGDTISTGAGDDTITYYTGDHIDGGIGTDTLRLAGSTALDLTGIDDSQITGIEFIDMTATGSQSLKLNSADALALSDTTDTVTVRGTADDTVTLQGLWVAGGTQPVVIDGTAHQFSRYTLDGATVLLDPAVQIKIDAVGGAGNDSIGTGTGDDTVSGGAGNDTLDGGNGSDVVEGGAGNDVLVYDATDTRISGDSDSDTLRVDGAGTLINMFDTARPAADGTRPTLDGIETVDLNTAGANYLALDADAVNALKDAGAGTLTVSGNSSDVLFIDGTLSGGVLTTGGSTAGLATSGGVVVKTIIDGTSGADSSFASTSGMDMIRALGGDDSVDGGAGADFIYAGDGNDTVAYDAADLLVDGGAGSDTLAITGTGTTVDLTAVADSVLKNFETIDLTGTGNNALVLGATDVAALNTDHALSVTGDSGDTLTLKGGWARGADDGSGNAVYKLDGNTVTVSPNVAVSVVWTGTGVKETLAIQDDSTVFADGLGDRGVQKIDGSGGNDTIDGKGGADSLSGGTGDDTIVADIGSDHLIADALVDGGSGTDTLKFTGAGQKLELTDAGSNKISGIEIIDLSGTGDNVLVINPDNLKVLSDTTDTLIVTGDAGDAVRLDGTWEARGSEKVNGITYNKYGGTTTDGSMVTILTGLSVVKGDVIYGTTGDDTLTGGTGADDVQGLDGNDSLSGGAGADEVSGGTGNDTIAYDASDITLDGGDGTDVLKVDGAHVVIDSLAAARPQSGALRPMLNGFESVDLSGSGDNFLLLGQDTDGHNMMDGTTAVASVTGDTGDVVFVESGTIATSGNVRVNLTTHGTSAGEAINGTDVADATTGGYDAIKAGAGNDTIDAKGGVDLVWGEAGDDSIVYDAADLVMDGGSGNDTLVVKDVDTDWSKANLAGNTAAGDVDLTNAGGSQVRGIEMIDLRGNGHQTLKLDKASVLAMSDTGTVTVKGSADVAGGDDDTLKLYGAWVLKGLESDADGNIMRVLQLGDAVVKVDKAVTLDITNELGGKVDVGTDGNDTVTVPDNGGAQANDGDDTIYINNTSFTGVDGGRGYDTVKFGPSWTWGGTLNASLLPPTALTNIEEINLSGYGNNKLILTGENAANMTDSDHILVVTGDGSGDAIEFRGTWTPIASAPTVTYNGVSYKDLVSDNGAHVYYQPNLTVTNTNPTPQMSVFSVDYNSGEQITNTGIDEMAGRLVENIGDFNGDGRADLLVNLKGQAYVVYGSDSIQGELNLDNLGTAGFKISNVWVPNGSNAYTTYDYYRQSENWGVVGAGDVNGDGKMDLLAMTTGSNYYTPSYKIIYGTDSATNIDLTSVSGATTLTRSDASVYFGVETKVVSSVGDVNGDGYADFMITDPSLASNYSTPSDNRWAGNGYLVFGGPSLGSSINMSTMPDATGIQIQGARFDNLGYTVTGVGDVNGDGIGDFLLGAPETFSTGSSSYGTTNNADTSGGAYLVFGKSSGWADLNFSNGVTTENGTNNRAAGGSAQGWVYLSGDSNSNAYFGRQIAAAGDVNGDGLKDFIVGSQDYQGKGKYYLVLGQTGNWADANLADLVAAGKAVEINGDSANGDRITRVTSLGDLNKDGYADILVAAGGTGMQVNQGDYSYASNEGDTGAGAVFVVYGRQSWSSSITVTQQGKDAIEITGGLPMEQLGQAIAAGDFNGDGQIDLALGQPDNHRNGFNSGGVFVLEGGDFSGALMDVGTSGSETVIGDYNANKLAGQGGNDYIYGLGGADILRGGAGNDVLGMTDLAFKLIDGGTGTDTLKFIGHNIQLDVTGYAGSSLRSLEAIDIRGDGANGLTMNYNEVVDLLERKAAVAYGAQAKMVVTGDADDKLTLEGPWYLSSTQYAGTDNEVRAYVLEGITVEVHGQASVAVMGWTTPSKGAQLDLGAATLPNGLRTDFVSGSGNTWTAIEALGDVNGDGLADFGVRTINGDTSALHSVYRNYTSYNNTFSSGDTSSTYSQGDYYVVFGHGGGVGAADLNALAAGSGVKLVGGTTTESFGYGAGSAAIGDINGDGISDLLIGAPMYSDTVTYTKGGTTQGANGAGWSSDYWSLSEQGRAYLFLGDSNANGWTSGAVTGTSVSSTLPTGISSGDASFPSGTTTYTQTTNSTSADAYFEGSSTDSSLGFNITGVGDVNGDGRDDFLISTNDTTLKLVFGDSTTATWTGGSLKSLPASAVTLSVSNVTNYQSGYWTVAGVGDVNHDGYADFWVGNSMLGGANSVTNGGMGYMVFGKSTWTGTQTISATSTTVDASHVASVLMQGSQAYGGFGHQVQSLGDINGDGYDDVIFSGIGFTYYNAGRNSTYDYQSVLGTSIGDANYQYKQDGAAFVMYGASSGWDSTITSGTFGDAGSHGFRVTGGTDFDWAGVSVTGVGDINGDGYDDFALTSSGDDEAGINSTGSNGGAGSSYLIFGRETGFSNINLMNIQDYGMQLLSGTSSNASIQSIQGLGDLDGDGLDDVGILLSSGKMQILYGSEQLTDGNLTGVQHAVAAGSTLTATQGSSLLNGIDRLIGNAGNDILTSDGGKDVLLGGAGNDTLNIVATGFGRVDGGTGQDTLHATVNLDFTATGASAVQNIERIDITGAATTVTLNAQSVIAMTGEKNTLVDDASYQKAHTIVIDGDSGDTAHFTDSGWTLESSNATVSGAGSFSVYHHGTDEVYVAIANAITKS